MLMKSKEHLNKIEFIKQISEGKNNKRINFNWDHLQIFYNIYK
jgi:hypothetical protein